MLSNWEKSFHLVISHEGGFSDDPRDNGNKLPDGRPGSTMLGCTQANWENFIGRKVTHDEMRRLTKEDVKPLYKKNYWDAVMGDVLCAGLDYAAFDFAINAGPSRSRKLIQKSLGITADGIFGKQTLKAIKESNGADLIEKFSKEKEAYYRSLADFQTYGKGWLRRIADVKHSATQLMITA